MLAQRIRAISAQDLVAPAQAARQRQSELWLGWQQELSLAQARLSQSRLPLLWYRRWRPRCAAARTEHLWLLPEPDLE